MLYSTTAFIISFNERLVLVALIAAGVLTLCAALSLRHSSSKKKSLWLFLGFFLSFGAGLLGLSRLTEHEPLTIELIRLK